MGNFSGNEVNRCVPMHACLKLLMHALTMLYYAFLALPARALCIVHSVNITSTRVIVIGNVLYGNNTMID